MRAAPLHCHGGDIQHVICDRLQAGTWPGIPPKKRGNESREAHYFFASRASSRSAAHRMHAVDRKYLLNAIELTHLQWPVPAVLSGVNKPGRHHIR